jgi:transposase
MVEFGKENFLKLYQTERNARGKIRFLALHHLQQGRSKAAVCELLCISWHTLTSWVLWYKKEGVGRLRQKAQGRGAKPKISAPKEELQLAISKLQEDREGGRIIGDDIRKMIAETYQVNYNNNYIYELLSNMDLSWVSVRSKHPKSDPAAMEAFKKTFVKTS